MHILAQPAEELILSGVVPSTTRLWELVNSICFYYQPNELVYHSNKQCISKAWPVHLYTVGKPERSKGPCSRWIGPPTIIQQNILVY